MCPPPPPPARFTGDGRAYWRILLRGAVLLAVTLGIYRFWLATDVRRFLWSNTEVAGESLEYTGTPYELLIGFLIALALLVPLYAALALAALSAGPVGAAASALSFPVLFFLGQFAVFRARRYRLTRTVYRGVRCHQDGSAIRYAICASFWWIMVALTVGLAYPFMQSRLERFKMRHTYFGDLKGRFEGSGLRLLLRGFFMWLLVVGPLIGTIVFGVVTVDWETVGGVAAKATSLEDFNNQLDSAYSNFYDAVVVAIAASIFSIVMLAVLYPVFQAMVLRWWIDGLRLGDLDDSLEPSHRSDLRRLSALSRLWPPLRHRGDGGRQHRGLRADGHPGRQRQQGRRRPRQCGRRHRLLRDRHAGLFGNLSGDCEARLLAEQCRIPVVHGARRARPRQGERHRELRGRRRPRRRAQCGRHLMVSSTMVTGAGHYFDGTSSVRHDVIVRGRAAGGAHPRRQRHAARRMALSRTCARSRRPTT